LVPIAIAILVRLLVQSPPLLMPKNDAHVALAVGAGPQPGGGQRPDGQRAQHCAGELRLG
jgi:hypothetical protein